MVLRFVKSDNPAHLFSSRIGIDLANSLLSVSLMLFHSLIIVNIQYFLTLKLLMEDVRSKYPD